MKKFFLIPLMTLMCSVIAWADPVVVTNESELSTALSTGGEIQLENDIECNSMLMAMADFTLDLNTHRIYGDVGMLFMAYGVTATITNGTIQSTKANGSPYGMFVLDGCSLTLTNVNLTSVIPDNSSSTALGITSSSAATSVTMTGGTITGRVIVDGSGSNACSFTMNSGTINGDAIGVEVTNNSTFVMNGGTINSYSQAGPKAVGVFLDNGSTLNVNGGTISAECDQNWAYGVQERHGSSVFINSGHILATGLYAGGLFILENNSSLTMSNGEIRGATYGIVGNGSYSGTIISISGGNITGDGAGIYHPQAGTLNIKGNPVITGRTAIQLCSGVGMTGSITGGRFEAYGEDERATKGGDGLIPDGAALSIVNRNYPGGMPQFTIKGGVFLAQHQDAILAYTWHNNTASEWAAATSHLSAQEGIFSSDPTTYVPADGYTVEHLNPTPTVYNHGEVVYADLWQIGETTHTQSYDFTEEPAEYVEISSTTPSEKLENKTYTLNEDQSSKKVEVAANYKLVVSEDIKLNIGNGGLDLNAGSQVVVEPGAVVTVGMNGITSISGTDNLVLQANSEKQAALLIDPDVIQNTQPLATVILSTKARQKSANPWNYIWEYFASPVVEITSSNKPTNNFNSGVHGLFQGETEFITGVYTWGGNDWALVNSWTSLVPFKGYQLTNNSANGGVEYTFKGNLLGNEDGEYAFTSNGYGYFGNSYSAPIVISNFLSALDNAVYERTVWLYDAGADTYVSVNPLAARIGSAKYKDGTVIKEIRSLQAFILNKKADGANAPINYRDAIWNNPRINSLVSAASAPARERVNDMQWMNIYVAANGNKEMVTLVEGEDFSDAFDNGADAGKYINNNSMNLYAATNDGDLAIVATDNLENTLLSFQAGNATEYTLTFENSNENYMLRDNVTGLTIAMIEGAEYSFTQAANSTAQARFEVIGIAKVPTAIENVEETAKKEGIYTLSGQYMGRDFTKLPAGVYVVNGVKIVK